MNLYGISKSGGALVHYVSDKDIAAGIVQVVPESERAALLKAAIENPDTDDLKAFRHDSVGLHKGPPVVRSLFQY